VRTVDTLSITYNRLLVLEIEPEQQPFFNAHDQVFLHAGSLIVGLSAQT
jgi:hypothetical protein